MTTGLVHGLGSHQVDWELASIDSDESPKLGNNEVHLWAMNLAQPMAEQVEHYLPWLSSRESKKYARLPDKQKNHYLRGRVVLRKLLAKYLGRDECEVSLSFGRYGKPALIDCSDGPWFNYSDTQGMVIYAIGSCGELGIDIEHLSRNPDYQRILERKFSLTEAEEVSMSLDKGSDRVITQRFLAAWTRKESYGKAIGVGVNYKMNEIEVAKDLGQATIKFEVDGKSWCMAQLLFDEYVVNLTTAKFGKLRCFSLID